MTSGNENGTSSVLGRYRHPILFFGLCIALPWALWFAAAVLSHNEALGANGVLAASILGMAGLASPIAVAAVFFLRDREILKDLIARFARVGSEGAPGAILSVLLMPVSILMAMAISLLFGQSPGQFAFRGPSFSAGLYPAWTVLVLAPVLEELAWHSYGTDCLRSRMSLFTATILFGIYWVLWHVPLAFIKGYYQADLVASGAIYSLNYVVSIPVFMILMNWLYVRTGRSVLVTIVFHTMANLSGEMFATHPDSKVIQTGLLLVLAIIVVVKDRRLFFSRPAVEPSAGKA